VAKSSSSKESVTRVKATGSKKTKKTKSVNTPTQTAAKVKSSKAQIPARKTSHNPLVAFFAYFKGSWYELRQVRWPNRKATWSLTGAVLAFSAFFVVFILLLDSLFKYIFELILQ
jgi:preprotein translocase subunit SecE